VSERLYVGTRKGLFVYEKHGTVWEIRSASFVGDPVSMVLPDSRDGSIYAALDLGHFGVKMRRSDNSGESWKEVGVPQYEKQAGKEKSGPSVKLLWSLASAGPDRPSSLWAGTIPGGLFRSDDRGKTWKLNRALWEQPEREKWFGGGYDEPGIHSVCVDPTDSRRVAVGISCGGFWLTEDEGETWRVSTKGMYAEYMPPERREDPAIQDPHCIVQCRTSPSHYWTQHHNGIFHSADGGASWESVQAQPSSFGFATAVHPEDPNTAWFVPAVKDECRVPVDAKVVVTRTRDGGRSFDVLRDGLPQDHAYDLVYRHGLDIDETGNRLAMGSTTGSLWLTDDQGEHWKTLSSTLPPVYCVRFG
jgi:photosystem II stability/assembly factor-like uncharacterized protein